MQLLHEAESVLRNAAFKTAHDRHHENVVAFEDDVVVGFVAIHNDVGSIIERWRKQQDDFLARNATFLRRDPRKAWNVYSVFLTEAPSAERGWDLFSIEADFNGTRKIARCGLLNRSDVVRALSSILPLAGIEGRRADPGVKALVQGRLSREEQQLFDLLSVEKVNEATLTAWLSEGP